MKLYYAPGVCSIGIHVLLEEIGKPYELEAVNLREGAQYKPEFTSVSAKSKVPTLQRDDGSILTEFRSSRPTWRRRTRKPS
jgi:glutathione S-transferase